MPPDFKPSPKSLTPAEQAGARLRYLCKAADLIQRQLEEEGDLPPWVLDRIMQSAQLMGMAVSYVAFSQERKFAAQSEEKTKSPKGKATTRKKK